MDKLIVGCGYLGVRVAQRWRSQGHRVLATTRRAERAAELAALGIEPIVADVTQPAGLPELPPASTVLYCVGYERGSALSRWDVYTGGLANTLSALPPGVERFLYISSTGVYGGADGKWVDEDSPCQPSRESGRAFLATEELLMRHEIGVKSIILRMAGLYGPGRIPRRTELVEGLPVAVPAAGFLNLIHVDDMASVVLAAESRAEPPRLYLASDGHPAERRAYFVRLAEVLGAPPPTFVEPDPASPVAQRATSSKRASNARLLAELGVELAYPSYREGLAATVAAEDAAARGE